MDSPPPSSEPSPARVPLMCRRAVRRFLFFLVCVLFVIVVIVCLPPTQEPRFVWLTPAQAAQANRVGPLTSLKYKLMRMAGPLMRYYHGHRPNIRISTSIMMSPATAGQPALGAPFVTNDRGMSAWILSSTNLNSFQQVLKANSKSEVAARMTIQMANGMHASIGYGVQHVPIAPGIFTNVGDFINVVAKSSSSSINLMLDVSSTELAGVPGTNRPSIKTNFCTACRVVLPDASSLVINCGNADTNNSTNYWLIVSPVLIDANGKPVKK